MKIYMVGGAVRDRLLQRPVHDTDWVVVGASPEDMTARGFTPVGRDFPVFLHPETHEEYALARTERKSGMGYRGFVVHTAPDVTLEEDLARRDLTINAIAAPADWTGAEDVFDPYHGQADLQARVLRHVTVAFREDPVRILRVARFAARFTDFHVAPETLQLMREMVDAGEADHLVPERVWQEISRGLMEAQPSRMFEVLRACGALRVLLPELDRLWGVPQRAEYHPEVDSGVHAMLVLDMAAQLQSPLSVRFACLCHDFGKGTTPAEMLPRHIGHEQRSARLLQGVCARWRVPNDYKELADVVAREHGNIHRSGELNAAAVLRLLERCDALRKPARFAEALLACECDARGRTGFENRPYPQRQRLQTALDAALAVDTAPVAQAAAQRGLKGPAIGEAVASARQQAVAQVL
ncbi:multifunctional CCA addition/repair protein [Comamonas aquatica]|uniref:multifunctional CCA addition/repair protein n=1 Tax=Comamonas aquatica TaxID=225991 RepID=UPI00244BE269|nr:multifunctional CCA addition/repair protein [Comamonas aquatica]MDH0201400.1 multifunctional CCA addition/repair protein [Comamonas aquatica]MDH0496017.1 multifunctional CCA addition/repair protein [Comamonas aquatica]MDH1446370.1 multifunctional CCA addition/repair protein [Comamonas aquatica]MDH1673243.1 multifunctional CCA addition/repair protein [Comamonas aquatica]MDH1678497.1 multifunctional CCA addition/repair protein [Comamonas aquatica]